MFVIEAVDCVYFYVQAKLSRVRDAALCKPSASWLAPLTSGVSAPEKQTIHRKTGPVHEHNVDTKMRMSFSLT